MPDAKELLAAKFGPDAFVESVFRDNQRFTVPAARLLEVMTLLKADGGFDYLVDITGIDYLHYPDATDRYAVVYSLASTDSGKRVFVKVMLNDPDPTVDSVYSLWKGADWMEREVFDMFGVTFTGHPDLRRILLPDGFESFPLRKDYPLRGKGERHNFETVTRAES
jgi:NADH-quinone oxidoreductase subunit C